MKKMKVLVVLLAIVMVLSMFAACGQKKEASLVDSIKEQGFMTLGTSADYPPYEFHALIDGEDTIVGFDIAIAQEIADELDVELKISDMNFDGLLAALMSGNVDLVIAGMSPTDERKESVDFSEIYYFAQQGVLIRAEDADKYKTIEDLADQKVGVQTGSIQEGIANDQMSGSQIISIPKIPDLVLELTTGKVEAVVMEVPVAESYLATVEGLAISDVAVEDDTGGSAAAIAKGNEDFVELVNKVIARLMEDGSISAFYAEAKEIEDAQAE